jgi:hypothetical protein
MQGTATTHSGFRDRLPIRAARIALVIMATLTLLGCDKCGDWFSPLRGDSQSCREQAPRPQ